MKKENGFLKKTIRLAFVACLMLSVSLVNAQESNPGPKFGVKAGINLSQLYVNQPNAEDESMKLGYNIGLFGKIPISNFLAVQPELLYTNVGSKVSYGGSDLADVLGIERGEVRFNLNYVQVPIALVGNIGAFNIHAGPYFSYLVGANVKNLKMSDLNSTEVKDLKKDNFNRLDFGLVGGIGVNIDNFTVGARYNHGLREVGSKGLAGNLTNNSKNAVIQLYVGVGF